MLNWIVIVEQVLGICIYLGNVKIKVTIHVAKGGFPSSSVVWLSIFFSSLSLLFPLYPLLHLLGNCIELLYFLISYFSASNNFPNSLWVLSIFWSMKYFHVIENLSKYSIKWCIIMCTLFGIVVPWHSFNLSYDLVKYSIICL